jgi:hypothetical protein
LDGIPAGVGYKERKRLFERGFLGEFRERGEYSFRYFIVVPISYRIAAYLRSGPDRWVQP